MNKITLVITNAIKLAGLVVVIDEIFAAMTDPQRPLVLAVSAFMMAGAQFSEGVILAAIDRILGTTDGRKEGNLK